MPLLAELKQNFALARRCWGGIEKGIGTSPRGLYVKFIADNNLRQTQLFIEHRCFILLPFHHKCKPDA